ncbi:MAG TPA: hypothetical protein VK190_04710 [Pseudoneobacillus sp.]|nr:hypothetical protein [Pseudoneobacillus sp.]
MTDGASPMSDLGAIPRLDWTQLIIAKTRIIQKQTELIKENKLTKDQLRKNLVNQTKYATYLAAVCMRQIELLDESEDDLYENIEQ